MFGEDLDKMLELAKKAKAEKGWGGFADYLEQHGAGVRKRALESLNLFLNDAVLWPLEERLRFTLWLLDSIDIEALVQPLKLRLVIPTIREWESLNPLSPEPPLWLGLLHCDKPENHIRRALELDPKCEKAREILCQWIIADISYNQHELPAFYIHDPRVDLADLAEAEALCLSYEHKAWVEHMLSEIMQQRALAEEWLENHPRLGDFASY
ncbi:hypothetical protein [Asticcacaulis machinosus]|uniref:HEAT repeat domain-containing protein n=1 Tax=Asticcacaulis machinosus TaxID=2984211 RepID=A0ABT5HKJ2_9CAUL|nr:hypothetical protein [Asticcacaulis machinosus]MDC7676775.1 hypothetical protein [Asticcacaulis machinosus]